MGDRIEVQGNTGAGSATGSDARVEARSIAGRDVTEVERNVNVILDQLGGDERVLATLVWALHKEQRDDIERLRAELGELRRTLHTNGLQARVAEIERRLAEPARRHSERRANLQALATAVIALALVVIVFGFLIGAFLISGGL